MIEFRLLSFDFFQPQPSTQAIRAPSLSPRSHSSISSLLLSFPLLRRRSSRKLSLGEETDLQKLRPPCEREIQAGNQPFGGPDLLENRHGWGGFRNSYIYFAIWAQKVDTNAKLLSKQKQKNVRGWKALGNIVLSNESTQGCESHADALLTQSGPFSSTAHLKSKLRAGQTFTPLQGSLQEKHPNIATCKWWCFPFFC